MWPYVIHFGRTPPINPRDRTSHLTMIGCIILVLIIACLVSR